MGMKFLYSVEPHTSFGCTSNVRLHHTSVFTVYEKRARDSYYSPSTPLLTDEHPLLSPGKQNSLPIVSQAAGEEWYGCLTLCVLQRKDGRLGHLKQLVSFTASRQPSLGAPLWAGHQTVNNVTGSSPASGWWGDWGAIQLQPATTRRRVIKTTQTNCPQEWQQGL